MTVTDPVGTCSACGTALAPGAPFCGTCGAAVPATVRAAVVAAARTAEESAPARVVAAGAPLPAAPGRRVAAFFVDQMLVISVMIATYVIIGAGMAGAPGPGPTDVAVFTGLLTVPIAASALVGLAQLVAEGRSGATVGNVALGIRTVRVSTTRPPGFGRAVLRRFIESLGGIVVFGQYLVAASSAWDRGRNRQGWQDKAAGTTMVTAASLGLKRAGAAVPASAVPGSPTRTEESGAARRAGRGNGEVPQRTTSRLDASPTGTESPRALDQALAGVAAPRPTQLISDVPGFAPAGADVDGGTGESTPVHVTPVHVPAPVALPEPGPTPETHADDALDRTRIAAPKPLHVTAYRLAFDTGESLVVSGAGLIGRNPAPGQGEVADHLIPITDPDRSVSKTHVAFGIGPDGFWVIDRGSTNGTAVSADGARSEAEPGARVAVPEGGTVEFGDRSFTVSRA